MKRRDSLKALALTTFGIGVSTTSAKAENMPNTEGVLNDLFKDGRLVRPHGARSRRRAHRHLEHDRAIRGPAPDAGGARRQ